MNSLKWGIVSTGRIAEQFCHDMQYVSNGELVAVAARNKDNAQIFADKYSIDKVYQGYQNMFNDDDIDIVYIATPHNLHFEHVHQALTAGKSVLCEKPFTVSSDECRILTALAKEKGLFLMEAMWSYFLPALKQAKAWVEAGRIGKVKHIKADFGYPMPYDPDRREYNKALSGGCLLELGIYPLALAPYFLSPQLDNLYVKAHFAENGVEDDLIIIANTGEATLSLAASFQCKLQNWAYIIGEKGYIAIPDFWRANQCSLYELDEQTDHFEDQRESLGFNYEAEAVGEAILNGKTEISMISNQTSLWLQEQMEVIKGHF